MNNLSQECIEQILNTASQNGNVTRRYGFIEGAKAALTNPTIYQSAGLMTVEEALRFAEWVYKNYSPTNGDCQTWTCDAMDGITLLTTQQILTIFRNQNKEK